jgi:hypothetical protein
MKTPAGKECPHFYADFHRGRNVQTCRLVEQNKASAPWHPSDCGRCPVPEILTANASAVMQLRLTIKPGVLGIGRKTVVDAWCSRHQIAIADAFVGCPNCNAERPGISEILDALERDDHD